MAQDAPGEFEERFEEMVLNDAQPHDNQLDEALDLRHITGIAFTGAVGIGLFINTGEFITIAGSLGAPIAFAIAGFIVGCVYVSLAEMVCLRPVPGALMVYPDEFVDEGLGYAVGVIYVFANCVVIIALTQIAALITGYWQPNFEKISVPGITAILLTSTMLYNTLGVRTYGQMEWVVKWLKLILIFGLCALMIAVNTGAGPLGHYIGFKGYSAFTPGYNSTGFKFSNATEHHVDIPGGGGRFLSIWTCVTLATFAYTGGDMVMVTAGEARRGRRDLTAAAKYMYLVPVCLYVLASFLVGLNVNFLEPRLYRLHESQADITGKLSPFIIAVQRAGIPFLPGFLNACFLFSAHTAS
ncbi:MAG: Cationic amino acid transporter 2 [Trichoglossum hirsutum]|nr:MAG: Cationic amino acid transporter 2 [Trichoglossum hirsutum]